MERPTKRSIWGVLAAAWGVAGILGGCASSLPCGPEAVRSGTFCYSGHDFGRSTDPDYRQGVRDGCETGKGYFRKNYSLSRTSPRYTEGWMRGRTVCRPAGWSDNPTYSYHPLPSSRRNSSEDAARGGTRRPQHSGSAEPRHPMLVFPEDSGSLPPRLIETPEVVRYPE